MLKPEINLFPYQKEGIAFIEKNNGCAGILDTMGLGKSAQAIGFTAKHNLKTLVICPAYLKYNWVDEVNKFTNNSVEILDPANPPKTLPDYLIVNYESVYKVSELLSKYKFDAVVCDESQYMMNPNAQRTKATVKIAESIPKRILLSGTPIKNKVAEFYDQLKLINPSFTNRKLYMETYVGDKLTLRTQQMDQFKLSQLFILVNRFCIRREKSQVLKDLPPKMFQVIPVDLSKTARKQYDALDRSSGLKFITESKQIIIPDKLPAIEEMIEDHLSTDSKLIVFTKSVNVIKHLCQKFPNAVPHFGGLSPLERNNNVKRFQEDPNCKLLIGNIDTAVGYTATKASTVLFVDLPWTTADLKQAEDRAHRIGQLNSVTIKYVIAKNTIEENILQLLRAKEKLMKAVLSGQLSEASLDIKQDLLLAIK
jgi:SWI/SNF-related matrix-associated actin-dependent regulator 1 of chromatin subfamily A